MAEIEQPRGVRRAGAAYAVAAYTFWGFAPAYFVWIKFAAPLEVVAHRIVWSLPLLALLITAARQWGGLRLLSAADYLRLFICAVLLSANWLTFVYAIHTERIVETALGYYINPLVSIVLGWLVLGESMRVLQWLAAGVAALAVSFEVLMLGEVPWLGLLLAFSFGFYGLLRKQLGVASSLGLGIETVMLAPVALAFIVFWETRAGSGGHDVPDYLLLALGGVVTITPLLWFAAAAVRLPLTVLGFFQYIAPSLSLLLAVVVYGEPVAFSRWVCFGLIWLALAIFTMESVVHSRRARA